MVTVESPRPVPAVAAGVTLGSVIVESLSRYPRREAFIHGDRRLTYAQCSEIVGRLMSVYVSHGVAPGSGVAMLSPNRAESWLAQAAAYLLGCSFTGLQLLGGIDDHVFICDDAAARLLVVDESCAERGREVRERSSSLNAMLVLDADGSSEQVGDVTPMALAAGRAGEEDVAWLQYTGGTTGRPKGVMLPQRAIVAQMLSYLASCGIPEQPRYLAAGPLTHASVLPVLPTLARGGTVVTLPGFDPERWLRTVQTERINCALTVPAMLYALLDTTNPEDHDLSSLQTIMYGAAPMSPTRLVEAHERIGPKFQQIYGQTENVGTATTLRRDEHDPAEPERLASCGRSVVGMDVAVLDDDGDGVPAGEIGELAVRGRATMLGYRNLPDETAAAFHDGWLRSGDMARRDDDGFFYIVDRKKDMIISGGFNIYAREVEDVLTTHPAIADAAVIGLPDPASGERACAVVASRDPADPLQFTEMVEFLKGKGLMTQKLPEQLELVDALPRNPTGKVLKHQLQDKYKG